MNVDYLPLLVTALSIIGAALVYGYQKSIDRKTALIELRRKAYKKFIRTFVDMTSTPEHDPVIKRAYKKWNSKC